MAANGRRGFPVFVMATGLLMTALGVVGLVQQQDGFAASIRRGVAVAQIGRDRGTTHRSQPDSALPNSAQPNSELPSPATSDGTEVDGALQTKTAGPASARTQSGASDSTADRSPDAASNDGSIEPNATDRAEGRTGESDPRDVAVTASVGVAAPVQTPVTAAPTTSPAPVSTPPSPSGSNLDLGSVDQNGSSGSSTAPTGAAPDGSNSTSEPPAPAADDIGAAIESGSAIPADAVLARLGIDFSALLPGWHLQFLGPKNGMRGTTFPYEKRIDIYVRTSFSEDELLHVVAHEIGHAVDVTYLDSSERDAFASLRGYAGGSWWTGSGATDFSVGAGDWAECYAWMRMGHGPWYSNLGGPPSGAVIDQMNSFIG